MSPKFRFNTYGPVSIFFWIEARSRVPRKKYYFDRLGMLWRLALKTSIEHINFKSQDAHCVYMGGTTTLANIEIGLFWLANWGYLTFWKKNSGRIFCKLSLSLYKQLKDQNWSRIERQRVWYGPHVWISDVWWCLDRMNNYTFWNATILPCFQRSQRSSFIKSHIKENNDKDLIIYMLTWIMLE